MVESGSAELVSDLTFPVPAAVTLDWLGFPTSDWAMISHAFHDSTAHPHGSPEALRGRAAFQLVLERVAEEVDARLDRPRDDALTHLVQVEVNGVRLPRATVESLAFILIAGGVDTTSALAGSALLHLHAHPDDRARLIAEPGLLDVATEEFLRFYPPARTHARTVTKDVEFGGCQLRAGDRVLLSETSSGRDSAQFPDADIFVIDRAPNPHIAFGRGVHRCVGAHLARIVFHELMREVLERIPDYRLIDDAIVEYPNWSVTGGWSQLPAVFTPASRVSE
jgi:cytochrome P450